MNKKELLLLLADMLFAYRNKDNENPHDFEINAVNNTVDVLTKEYTDTKYTEHFIRSCKL